MVRQERFKEEEQRRRAELDWEKNEEEKREAKEAEDQVLVMVGGYTSTSTDRYLVHKCLPLMHRAMTVIITTTAMKTTATVLCFALFCCTAATPL
jgi:hypothetical protein